MVKVCYLHYFYFILEVHFLIFHLSVSYCSTIYTFILFSNATVCLFFNILLLCRYILNLTQDGSICHLLMHIFTPLLYNVTFSLFLGRWVCKRNMSSFTFNSCSCLILLFWDCTFSFNINIYSDTKATKLD